MTTETVPAVRCRRYLGPLVYETVTPGRRVVDAVTRRRGVLWRVLSAGLVVLRLDPATGPRGGPTTVLRDASTVWVLPD